MASSTLRFWRAMAKRAMLTYPRAWRIRYEQELAALLEDLDLGPREFIDLLRASGREWMRELVGPGLHRSAREVLRVFEDASAIALCAVLAFAAMELTRTVIPWFPDDDSIVAPSHTMWNVVPAQQLLLLVLRTAVLMRIVSVSLTWAYRRADVEPGTNWWWSAIILTAFLLGNVLLEWLAIRFHLWAATTEMQPLFKNLANAAGTAALMLAIRSTSGREVWRTFRRMLPRLN